jgi:iron(III) transport system substrate-binding protein
MHRSFSKRSALGFAVLVAALAAFVAASVGSAARRLYIPPPPATIKPILAQVKGLKIACKPACAFPNDPYDQKLHQLALQQGAQVNVYSSLSSFITTPLMNTWKQIFPDITLNFYRAGSEDVAARFNAEYDAGKPGADVVETNGTTMLQWQNTHNHLVPFRSSPWEVQIPKKYQFDTFTADRLEMFTVSWNTNLVQNPPKTFQDLADPSWKGKLALEPTDSDWFAALDQYFTTGTKPKMTQAQFEDMFKKIVANAQLIPGHSAEATALAAGQVSVVVTGHAQSMEQLQAKGAPIAFGPPFVDPVIQRPQGMGIPFLAPHPAAALLFYDFMISPVGQKMLVTNGVYPANPYFFDSAFKANPTLNVVKMDIRPIVKNYDYWNGKYQNLIQQ